VCCNTGMLSSPVATSYQLARGSFVIAGPRHNSTYTRYTCTYRYSYVQLIILLLIN
jgi:hypothetical protein